MPAAGEALPGYVFRDSWRGLVAPAGTPAPAVARIARKVAAAWRAGPVLVSGWSNSVTSRRGTPKEFAAIFAAELPRVAELVRISGASMNLVSGGRVPAARAPTMPAAAAARDMSSCRTTRRELPFRWERLHQRR